MKKLIGLSAVLVAFVVLLGSVGAQDTPPAGGKGGGKGFGGAPLSADAFMTKYDKNKDMKVTKDEYMAVAADDAKVAAEANWTKIAGTAANVDTKAYQKYVDDNPAPMRNGKGAGKGGKKGA